jgi:hypothetical protein
VLHGYHFDDFEYISILDQGEGRSLEVSRDDLEAYRKKEIDLNGILKGLVAVPKQYQ